MLAQADGRVHKQVQSSQCGETCAISRYLRFSSVSRCFHYAVLERGPTQLNIPRDMFYGDLTTAIPKPTPVERSAGGPAALAQAAQLLAAARNPVIISGGGVVMAGGVDQVVELAETCQVRGG